MIIEPKRKAVFLSRIAVSAKCWTYTGYLVPKGYGYMHVCKGENPQAVHRISYEIFKGPIASGLEIDHLCHNRACVNPFHLEAVTREENHDRCVRHLRHVAISKGLVGAVKHPLGPKSKAKLTVEDVEEIRASDLPHTVIATMYGVHSSHICDIRNFRRWNHKGKSS